MKRILGILGLFLAVYVLTWLLADVFSGSDRASFMTEYNHVNLLKRVGLYGIISVGVAFVIITGGIDLSIGSVVCLVGVGLPFMLTELGWPVLLAVPVALGVSLVIGLAHGLLITKLRLQPFIVTLCGLLIYRGLARGLTNDQVYGFQTGFKGLKQLAVWRLPITDSFGIPAPFLIMVLIAIVAAIVLNKTTFGRYLMALGNNEEAARLSGIQTDRMKIVAYVICAALAGLGGMLFVLDTNSAAPADFGNFFELYAIAAAVLGGCSLRGGQGTIAGVIIGAALMRLLYNTINLLPWIPNNIEFAVIGTVILAGVTVDELAKRVAARRRAAQRDA